MGIVLQLTSTTRYFFVVNEGGGGELESLIKELLTDACLLKFVILSNYSNYAKLVLPVLVILLVM